MLVSIVEINFLLVWCALYIY